MRLRPVTPLGQLSAWLLAAFAGGFAGLMASSAAGQTGGDEFSDNWWLAGPALFAAVSILAALVTGGLAIVREHERSPLVFLAVVIGSVAAFFMAGEVLFPH